MVTPPSSTRVNSERVLEIVCAIYGITLWEKTKLGFQFWSDAVADLQALAAQIGIPDNTSARSHAWYGNGDPDWVICRKCGILRPLFGCLLESRPCEKPDGKEFFRVSCTECKGIFGPRDTGYHNCDEHRDAVKPTDNDGSTI